MSAPAIERRMGATTSASTSASRRARATAWIVQLHDEMTELFTGLDGGCAFREDRWTRNGGGGGVTRILSDGKTFAKAGVNRSAVDGVLPTGAMQRLGGRMLPTEQASFFATGLSLVVHPRNPHVPTVHLNVRYFELTDKRGMLRDAWFGGGTDLTPMYPSTNDARFFHCALRAACDRFHPTFYPRFKVQCDEYFQSAHRGGEARGVGGVFFDHLRPLEDDSGLSASELFDFGSTLVRSLRDAYAPIVEGRRGAAYGERERQLQLRRRGRYAEFNLLHDRGTLFGLQTGARVESVLMSLPPEAAWTYAHEGGTDPLESALLAMLIPRDWAGEED